MPPRPLTNFEIQKYYQIQPVFHGVYSTYNLPKTKMQEKVKDGTYIANLNEHSDIGTNSIDLYKSNNMLLILIFLELNIFQKKLKKSLINQYCNKYV